MSLEKRCWACKSRRVRCDFARPSCGSCIRKGIVCPGYSATKPFRWQTKVPPESLLRTGPFLASSQLTRPDDIAPAHSIMDAVTYYNSKISPDMSAYDPTDCAISILEWLDTSISERHLIICIVELHKEIRALPEDASSFDDHTAAVPMRKELVTYYHHQACAARLLQDQVQAFSQLKPDCALMGAVSGFLGTSLQQSAYGACRRHLDAARTISNTWGLENLLPRSEFCYEIHFLMEVDVFAMTTAPASLLSPIVIEQHFKYKTIIGKLPVESWRTLTPLPDELLIALANINIRRANASDDPTHAATIMADIQAFDAKAWAASICGSNWVDRMHAWELLAKCFQNAMYIYLFLSHDFAGGCSELSPAICSFAYMSLKTCIRKLFDQRKHGGTHYKFLMWPMVIFGVGAVMRRDRTEIDFLCEELRAATIIMGTMAFREAAVFLEELWSNTWTNSDLGDLNIIKLDWNTIFERAPIFVM